MMIGIQSDLNKYIYLYIYISTLHSNWTMNVYKLSFSLLTVSYPTHSILCSTRVLSHGDHTSLPMTRLLPTQAEANFENIFEVKPSHLNICYRNNIYFGCSFHDAPVMSRFWLIQSGYYII